jgi:hypothetical protein
MIPSVATARLHFKFRYHRMIYWRQMRDLMPERTYRVTFAAFLAVLTGLYGIVAYFGLLAGVSYSGLRLVQLAAFLVLGCASIGALIGGFGILFRRNWARVSAIASAVPLIFSGLWDVYRILHVPAPLVRLGGIAFLTAMFVVPLLAPMAWVGLLVGKKARAEFLPPATVEIYVNLLNEGTSCAKPTQALVLGNGLYELLTADGYDSNDEHWEFRPGTIVRGKEELRDGETYLLATSFGP